MARIRSIHPEQFKDENFVGLSLEARLLCIGLRNYADDYGVFEWKPIPLKIEIFPMDNVDMAGLLTELHEADIIRPFEHDGRKYGVIRNFLKYQSPQKPSCKYPQPTCFTSDEEMMRYMAGDSSREIPKIWRSVGTSKDNEDERREEIPTSALPPRNDGTSTGEVPEEYNNGTGAVQHGEGEGEGIGDGVGKGDGEEKSVQDPPGEPEGEQAQPKVTYNSVKELFHKECPSAPKVKVLTESRKRAIKSRLKEHGLEGVTDIFRRAEVSDFLSGRNGKWTACGFDWLLKQANAVKVLEGMYDNGSDQMKKDAQFGRTLGKFSEI